MTGFICRTQSGSVATLQRDGSDYSAAIVGRLLRASAITIWTDVDGVLSADPRAVPDARCLQSLSYAEAMELSYFGAKVMHPRTMHPAVLADIPIYMRNSFNPSHPGTKYPIEKVPHFDLGPILVTMLFHNLTFKAARRISPRTTLLRVLCIHPGCSPSLKNMNL